MRKEASRIDIEKSIATVFKYKDYKEKGYIPIIILEDEEEVDLSNYKARVFFEISVDEILEKTCEITNNVIKIDLDKNIFIEKGKLPFEIVLDGNNQRVTTFKMYLKV